MRFFVLFACVFASIVTSHPIVSDLHTPLNATTLQRREILAGTQSSFTITTYPGPNCEGSNIPYANPTYSANQQAEIYSYKLNRALDPSEQLDFSFTLCEGTSPDDLCISCGKYYSSAWQGAPAGTCFQLGVTAACFRLWHH